MVADEASSSSQYSSITSNAALPSHMTTQITTSSNISRDIPICAVRSDTNLDGRYVPRSDAATFGTTISSCAQNSFLSHSFADLML